MLALSTRRRSCARPSSSKPLAPPRLRKLTLEVLEDRALLASTPWPLESPTVSENTPPAIVVTPAGPSSGQIETEIPFVFSAQDADGDAVQFRIDFGDGSLSPWSGFQIVAASYVLAHTYDADGTMQIRANVRDEHGATSGFTLVHTIEVAGDVGAGFVTMPYLQNVTPESIVIMWEMDSAGPVDVEYGLGDDYGALTAATSVPSGYGATQIYKAQLAGLLSESQYHYRLTAAAGEPLTADRLFRTGTTREIDFAFGTWSDSQGHNHGAWTADPLEPTTSMMAHMAAGGVDFGFSTGDLAESGNSYYDTRNYYLDRVAKYLGQTVPWFNAWGNHDSSIRDAVIRRFADMPSKDRPGYTPGFGSYYFTYANTLFIAIDYYDDGVITGGWLENLLQSDLNRNARFTIVGVHVPPYSERWIDGSSFLRANLVPLMEQYGVDVCISGHTHAYARGELNGVNYVMTGGGSWLDLPEPLIRDWPHMTVGGYHDLDGTWARQSSPGVLGPPQPIRGGLVNEYVRFEIRGNHLEAEVHAFNADGSYVGVLDAFSFGDTPGVNDSPSFASVQMMKPAASTWTPYAGSLLADATDPDQGDVLAFSKIAGPAWLEVAADGTLAGTPTAGELGTNVFTVRVTDVAGLFDETTLRIEVEQGVSAVLGRYVFYNNSAFDTAADFNDDAIAPDKRALLPGEIAGFAHYTSYSRGINGIMVDVAGSRGTIAAADFRFNVGNDANPARWTAIAITPAVEVRTGQGIHGSDRVTIVLPDHRIKNTWLQVTLLANANTELLEDDVFYFGNAVGESGDSADDAMVTAADEIGARNNTQVFQPAAIDNVYDFNRDGMVTAADQIIARRSASPFDGLNLDIQAPTVRITEAGTRAPDWLEIQNVADYPVETAGWVVAVNNGDQGAGAVHQSLWHLPDYMAASEVLYRTDDETDNYWGENIYWNTAGAGWAMILNRRGKVVDFVIWGYDDSEIASLEVEINTFTFAINDVWHGPAVPQNPDSSYTLQRSGSLDHDSASDWAFAPWPSMGRQNDPPATAASIDAALEEILG